MMWIAEAQEAKERMAVSIASGDIVENLMVVVGIDVSTTSVVGVVVD